MSGAKEFWNQLVEIWEVCFNFFPSWFEKACLAVFAVFIVVWCYRLILAITDLIT